MPVSFVKRKGKVVGMTMTFAEMRWAYKTLKGVKLPDDKFQECGTILMADFTEQQILDAVATYNRETFLNSTDY